MRTPFLLTKCKNGLLHYTPSLYYSAFTTNCITSLYHTNHIFCIAPTPDPDLWWGLDNQESLEMKTTKSPPDEDDPLSLQMKTTKTPPDEDDP